MSLFSAPVSAFYKRKVFSLQITATGQEQSPVVSSFTLPFEDATYIEQTAPTNHPASTILSAGSFVSGSAGARRRILLRPDLSLANPEVGITRIDFHFHFRDGVLEALPIDWAVHQMLASNGDWQANVGKLTSAAAVGTETSWNLKSQTPSANWVNGAGANNPGLTSTNAYGPELARSAPSIANDGDPFTISVIANLTSLLTNNVGFLIKAADEIPLTNATVYGPGSTVANYRPRATVYQGIDTAGIKILTLACSKGGIYFYRDDQLDAMPLYPSEAQVALKNADGDDLKVAAPDGEIISVAGWR